MDDNIFSQTEFHSIFDIVKDKDALKLEKNLDFLSSLEGEEDNDPFTLRNKKYNQLIDCYTTAYKNRHDLKNQLKKKFFWVVMPIYIVVVLSSLFILIASLFVKSESIALIIGAIGSLVTTLVAIPTIIANYLFPKQEDSNLVDMFKLTFDFDTKHYTLINEAKLKASQKIIEKQKNIEK